MSTFKAMIKSGQIKRADAMKVRYEDLHVEPGFNERIEGEDLEESINALADYIFDGGMVPPLEVRPRAEGGVWIVDGHRRHRGYGKAIERGAPIEWVEVRPFSGNDADRVARIVTSNQGRPLSPLETSRVYKRLAAFGWSPTDIARKVGKSRSHVEQLLLLANSNTDVQQAVQRGDVAAHIAVDTVRKYGDRAGQVIAKHVTKANSEGKKKATSATIKGRAMPREISDNLATAAQNLLDSIPTELRQEIETATPGQKVEIDALKLKYLFTALGEVDYHREKEASRIRDAVSATKQTAIEEPATTNEDKE